MINLGKNQLDIGEITCFKRKDQFKLRENLEEKTY